MTDIFERLAEPFPFERVHWRIGSKSSDGQRGQVLAYLDARDVMERLDDVLGPDGWYPEYREVMGRVVCRLYLRIKNEWIAKEDGSGDSNFESEKGGISGALKRAAVVWGVGRYLYDCTAPWIDLYNGKIPDQFDGSRYLSAFSSKQMKTKYYKGLKAAAADDDSGKARELWDELSNEQRLEIWRMFGSESGVRSTITNLLESTGAEAA